MEIRVKTLNEDGSINFEGTLRQNEVQFVLEIGVNFLLANGASPFMEEDEEQDESFVAPGTDTLN
jgi:hypothetical protein